MSHPTSHTMNQTPPVRRAHTGLIVLWAAQVLLAAAFILSGVSKLAGVSAFQLMAEEL